MIEPTPPLAPPSRRHLLTLGAGALLGACAQAPRRPVPPKPEALEVPHSTGQGTPSFEVPPLACDCHHHIYDRRYPAHPSATLLPADASLADYRLLQRRLGLQRQVIVQPSTYGTDNRLLSDTLRAAGPQARGVAVLGSDAAEAELQALHEAGVRGVRFNLSFLVGVSADMMVPLSRRLVERGWHLQVNGTADLLLAHEAALSRLACPLVIDHMGQLPQPAGLTHPAWRLYQRWLDGGRTWFKLSGAYLPSRRSDFADVGEVARALLRQAPERMVWGSDWPHPTKREDAKPDDTALFNLLATWAPDAGLRQKILVDNPAVLYGFPST
jgi:D-galactarolactone isomerase